MALLIPVAPAAPFDASTTGELHSAAAILSVEVVLAAVANTTYSGSAPAGMLGVQELAKGVVVIVLVVKL